MQIVCLAWDYFIDLCSNWCRIIISISSVTGNCFGLGLLGGGGRARNLASEYWLTSKAEIQAWQKIWASKQMVHSSDLPSSLIDDWSCSKHFWWQDLHMIENWSGPCTMVPLTVIDPYFSSHWCYHWFSLIASNICGNSLGLYDICMPHRGEYYNLHHVIWRTDWQTNGER